MTYMLIKPVTVWEGTSVRQTLIDVEGAANFLLLKWPKAFSETQLHRDARVAAMEALGHDGTAGAFREAFMAAAAEAGILDEELERPSKRRKVI